MKKKLSRRTISTILIVIGIIVCLIPVVGRLYTNYEAKLMYEEYLAEQAELEDELAALDEALDDVSTPAAASKPAGIGRISIPCIKSDQLLLEGSSSKQLKWGAGHITGTAMPGELGNCAIAGHRNYTFGSYFSRLGEVVTGDTINVDYDGQHFTYKVVEIFVVTPDDTSVLRQGAADRTLLTLITCHPKGKNTHRLIVRAELASELAELGAPEPAAPAADVADAGLASGAADDAGAGGSEDSAGSELETSAAD